jgi:transposase InsO family protein
MDQLEEFQSQSTWSQSEREFCEERKMIDGLLHRKRWEKDTNGALVEHLTIIVPESLRQRVLEEVHQGRLGEHQGFLTTFQKLKARFHWPNMRQDAKEYVARCLKCQHFGSSPATSGYGDHLKADRPGQKWVTDVLYLENDGNYEMAVTLVDIFSRWSILRPIKDRKSETIAQAIMQMWAESGVHFIPEVIVHDNGSEFKKLFEKVCELMDVEQSWSVAGRPESHGVIEKFNQDICQLLGKKVDDSARKSLKPHEKKWSWAIPAVEMAINSSFKRANMIGLDGYTPSEIFHGLLPVIPLDRALRPKAGMVAMNEVGVEDRMEAIRSSQRRAVEFVERSRGKYEQELDQDRRYAHKTLRTFHPGDLVLKRTRTETGVARKTNPTYEVKPFVVIKGGHRGNYAVQPQREAEAEYEWVHVDQIKAYLSDERERQEAMDQNIVAREGETTEYLVEAIVGHRGSLREGDREVLVKWVGYEEPDWREPETLRNPNLVTQYFRRGNPAQRVFNLASAVSIVPEKMAYEAISPNQGFVQADILQQNPSTLVREICKLAKVDPKKVVLVWASPPCRTFTNSAYNVGRGSGHGYNYRDFSDPERGPCCKDPGCPYRKMAVQHDQCVPHLQKMVQDDWDQGRQYDYVVENPHGCLGCRPYTHPEHWPDQRVNKFTVDQCAFGKLTQKPTDLWTSLTNFRPIGNTGDGKCRERCGRGYFTANGTYRHVQAYAQEPNRQPRGADRVSIPTMLSEEILGAAFDGRRGQGKVVIDLYCGHRSIAPVAVAMGMHYIGIDVDRYSGSHL